MRLFLAVVRENEQLDVYKLTCCELEYDRKPCFAMFIKDQAIKFPTFFTANSGHTGTIANTILENGGIMPV